MVSTATAREGYSSLRVMEKTGVTLRQLQWWDEKGYIVPKRYKGDRVYTDDQVAQVHLVLGMRAAGVTLRQIRMALKLSHWRKLALSANDCTVVDDTLVVFVGRRR